MPASFSMSAKDVANCCAPYRGIAVSSVPMEMSHARPCNNKMWVADMSNRLIKVGLFGTIATALCCFTPILVLLFGLVGLSALVVYLDYILFPLLGFFVLLLFFAIFRYRSHSQA
jgi:mercuric ion transport protein